MCVCRFTEQRLEASSLSMCVCVCVYTCVCMCVCICICKYTCMTLCTCVVCVCVCIYTYIYVYVHVVCVCVCVYVYIYKHMYIYIYMCRFTVQRLEASAEEKSSYIQQLEKETQALKKDLDIRTEKIQSLSTECDRIQGQCHRFHSHQLACIQCYD